MSPTAKFQIVFFHICLTCRLWRNSFLHLLQNSTAICCTRCHLLFEYASGLLNSPGGGMTTLVFIVWRLLGESGILLFESLMVSTVSGLELMVSSTSAINVLSDSSFKEWLWVFNNPSKIILADRIWHSQTPPMWEAPGGLLCHSFQSAPFLVRSSWSYVSSLWMLTVIHSWYPQNLFHCPTRLNGLFLF